MRAVRLERPGGQLELVEVPDPEPAGTQVRIRVAGCGVCHTDLHIVDGTQPRVEFPLILGHEVAGWVDARGADADGGPAEGEAVVVHGGWGCGACRACAAGEEQRCPTGRSPGFQADGGYAELMLVPHPRHLVPIGSLDPVAAAPLADAGVTPYRAVRRAEPWLVAGARVLIVGCGGLGQFALQYLRDGRDVTVAVSERSPIRLERAAELGADVTLLDPEAPEIRAALGGAPDVVLDFVGSDATLALAADVVAATGLIVLVGEGAGTLPFGFERPDVESWLTTTAWGSLAELREVVDRATNGRLRWEVEAMDLADASAAHDRVRSADLPGRVVLTPDAR
jgi:alcohol dehydrogenase, propanol-preferring